MLKTPVKSGILTAWIIFQENWIITRMNNHVCRNVLFVKLHTRLFLMDNTKNCHSCACAEWRKVVRSCKNHPKKWRFLKTFDLLKLSNPEEKKEIVRFWDRKVQKSKIAQRAFSSAAFWPEKSWFFWKVFIDNSGLVIYTIHSQAVDLSRFTRFRRFPEALGRGHAVHFKERSLTEWPSSSTRIASWLEAARLAWLCIVRCRASQESRDGSVIATKFLRKQEPSGSAPDRLKRGTFTVIITKTFMASARDRLKKVFRALEMIDRAKKFRVSPKTLKNIQK